MLPTLAPVKLDERRPRGSEHPALVVYLDAFSAQQLPLLVDGNPLAVLGPLALEAA